MQPSSAPEKSPFELLIDDISALRDARTVRDNARTARIASEAARNRRSAHVQQQQQVKRRLAKAAPPAPAPAPDWGRIAAQQAELETALRESAARATQNAVRDRLAGLAQEAKLGRLDVHSAALFDVLRGRAAAMGLRP